ncbi:DUF3150 domain-containing protein [Pelotomaculum propionicicum]|uniref:DUF3150 domain-containing protein n=1 Tax=Pelotomaculum propionicicum TaxID=258475 RepID=UPI003B819C30
MLKTEAKQNKDEFIDRVNAEFEGVGDWEEKKREIAELTGGDRIYVQRDVLATKLCEEGYIYKSHIGRTRFTVKLKPQDVGLDPDNESHKDFISRYLALGNKLLLPAEILRKLDRIDKQIRRTIDEEFGIPTMAGSFVPFKSIEAMKEKIETLKQDYFAVRDEILEDYERIKQNTELAYQLYAIEAYRLIRKDPMYEPTDEEISMFVRSTMAYFPTKEQIYSSFYVNLSVGTVETTEFLAAQESRLRLIKEREASYKEELRIIERKLTEDSRVQEEHERQRLLIEKERVKTKLLEEQSKQKAIEEAIAIKRDEYLPRMEQMFADLAGAVHGIIFDVVNKVTESIKLKGNLERGDTMNLKSLVDKVKNLAITPDPEVEGWIGKIQDIADTPSHKRDAEEVKEALCVIRAEAGKVILSLGRTPRTLRGADKTDIVNVLAEESIRTRQIRQLKIEETDSVPALVRQPGERSIS